jgi:hypothetical protein
MFDIFLDSTKEEEAISKQLIFKGKKLISMEKLVMSMKAGVPLYREFHQFPKITRKEY